MVKFILTFVSIILIFADISAGITFDCLAYSPFRYGESPNAVKEPSLDSIKKDILMIKDISSSLQTFGIDKGYLKAIPQIAESLSVPYTVGVWASFSTISSWGTAPTYLLSFLKTADSLKYKNLQGVLFGYDNCIESNSTYPTELSKVTYIKAQIDALRKRIRDDSIVTPVKLSHSENWDVWVRNPTLADSLDYITARIVPQTDLISFDQSVSYVLACYDTVKKYFPEKEVRVITGYNTYPYYGAYQKQFIDSLTAKAKFKYTLFSFSDESWKGTAEGTYGIYDQYRNPKKVVEKPPIVDTNKHYKKLLIKDTGIVDGVIWSNYFLNLPASITQPALETQFGRWADTCKTISNVLFTPQIYSSDNSPNSKLIPIFKKYGYMNFGADNYLDTSGESKITFFKYNSYLPANMTKADSVRYVDSMYFQILKSRSKVKNLDSTLFYIAESPPYNAFKDNMIVSNHGKYFDGFSTNYDFYDSLKSAPNIDSAVLAVLTRYLKVANGKDMLFYYDLYDLSYSLDPSAAYVTTYPTIKKCQDIYQALMKYKKIYNFNVVLISFPSFYKTDAITRSAVYNYIFPSRVGVELKNIVHMTAPYAFVKNNILYTKTPAEFSIFTLSGKKVGEYMMLGSHMNLLKMNDLQTHCMYIIKMGSGLNKTLSYMPIK